MRTGMYCVYACECVQAHGPEMLGGKCAQSRIATRSRPPALPGLSQSLVVPSSALERGAVCIHGCAHVCVLALLCTHASLCVATTPAHPCPPPRLFRPDSSTPDHPVAGFRVQGSGFTAESSRQVGIGDAVMCVCVCARARARVFCGGKADLVVVLCFGRTQQAFKPFDLYMYICI